MITHRRAAWILAGSLLLIAAFGVALSAPAPASARVQSQATPTLEPPSPRTPPAGPRGTPSPAPVQPTPGPTGAPPESGTPVPTPVVMPVTGGSPRGMGQSLIWITLLSAGITALAIGLDLRRRDKTR
jgi:hypothetical protein